MRILKEENYIEESLKKKMPGDTVKQQIEKELGISYRNFEKLDLDEQHKLIEEKTGRKLTFDDRLHIDGIPLDENHIKTIEQVDKQIDKIVHESSTKKLIRKFKKID